MSQKTNEISGFKIIEGDLEIAWQLAKQIEEFTQPVSKEKIDRLNESKDVLCLIAYIGSLPIGFKIGFRRENMFYSWFGGVLKGYRQRGFAKRMSDYMEEWAKEKGYTKMWMKTRNRFKPMLLFALSNGFMITNVLKKELPLDHLIILEKKL